MKKLSDSFEELTERFVGQEMGRRVRLLAWVSLLLVVSCLVILFLLRNLTIRIEGPGGEPVRLPLKSLLFRD